MSVRDYLAELQREEKAVKFENELRRFLSRGPVPIELDTYDSMNMLKRHVHINVALRPRFYRHFIMSFGEMARHSEGYFLDTMFNRIKELREELAEDFYEKAHFSVFD